MYKGIPSGGIDFYNLLTESTEFTSELGKVALASGKLEAEFFLLLTQNKVKGITQNDTLGRLAKKACDNKLISLNEFYILKRVYEQRNYLTHNIYALFIDLIEETRLEKKNLLDSDVHTYKELVWQLNQNLQDLSELIRKKIAKKGI